MLRSAMAVRVPRKPADAYQHGNLRPALIQAGLRLLAEGGPQNLSLRAAANLAGVSHAAPYRHFVDKDALVAAIAEEGFRLLTARMRAAVSSCRSERAVDRLEALALGYVGFAVEHPAHLRVVFGGVAKKDSAPDSLKAAGAEAYGLLRDTVAKGITSGELRKGDPDEVALACWSLTHGLGMLLAERALPPPLCERDAARELTRTVTKLLTTGINART